MFVWQNILFTLLALTAGTSFVIQQAVNANLSSELESAWRAGFISYLGGTLVMLVMVLVMRAPMATPHLVSRSTWWSWTGGFFGAVYIATSIFLLPRFGAFTTITLIVIGQLAASLIFDHFGILNVPYHPVSPTRILGAIFLLAGAVLIRW